MKSKWVVVSNLILFVSISGGITSRPSASAVEVRRVLLATGIGPEFSDLVIAVKRGLFEKYGIQAELKPFVDANVALDLILTGSADIGDASEAGGLVRRSKGGKIYVVGSGATATKAMAVVVRGNISQPKDLLGKRVGYSAGTGGHYFFERYVRHYGLDVNQIKQVPAQAPELLAALNRGDIDAFFLWEPWVSRALKEVSNTKIIEWNGDNNVFLVTQYWYFSQRMIDDRKLGVDAVRALVDAHMWIKSNFDEAGRIVAATYNLDPQLASELVRRWKWGEPRLTNQTRMKIREAGEFLSRAGVLVVLPKLDDYLHPEFLKEVNPRFVEE